MSKKSLLKLNFFREFTVRHVNVDKKSAAPFSGFAVWSKTQTIRASIIYTNLIEVPPSQELQETWRLGDANKGVNPGVQVLPKNIPIASTARPGSGQIEFVEN